MRVGWGFPHLANPIYGANAVGGGKTFRPTSIPNCVLWVRGDLGVTLNDMVIAAPNDLTGGSWGKLDAACTINNILAPDGTTTASFLRELATTNFHDTNTIGTNFVASVPITHTIYLKQNGRNWARLSGNGAGINDGASFNLATGVVGTIGSQVASATITAVSGGGGGWYRLTITINAPTNGNIWVELENGDNVLSYTGDGASGVYVWGANSSQPKVSAWADQSGNGNHITQGTAANQPLWLPNGLNNKPTLRFDGVNDVLASGAMTLVQPETICMLYKKITTAGPGTADIIYDGAAFGSMLLRSDNSPQTIIQDGVGFAAASERGLGSFVYATDVFNGASSTISSNGTQLATGNAGNALNANGFVLGAGATPVRWANIEVAEVIIYNRTLTAAEQALIDAYRKTRFAL